MWKNIILIALLLSIAGSIVWYLIRAKKKGQHCVGCPYAKSCGGNCNKKDGL